MAGPRVSVVVPVYNPGRSIEPGIESILGQTMGAGQVEGIFIDDGSTDGTADRLDRLAAEHPTRIRVVHIPPSGAPGRPRNVGIEAAAGDYVQFLDADDALAFDALERLVGIADRNDSDIVVEKFASATLRRSQRLFHENVERTTLAESPALLDSSLALAKLFRTGFIRGHGLAFPEGWRLLEDQSFVLRAYSRARTISILADHACYFFRKRDDGGHLTTEAIEPEVHVANLRAIIDAVESDIEPGSLRDRAIRRLIRAELLARFGEPSYQDMPASDRERFFDAGRALLRERVDARVVAELGAVARIRAELLLADRPAELLTLARRMDQLDVAIDLERGDWRNGTLEFRATAALRFADEGRALVVRRLDGRTVLDAALADDRLGHAVDVSADLRRLRVEYILQARTTALEWHVRGDVESRGAGTAAADARTVTVASSVRIDPLRVGTVGVALDAGSWDLLLRVSVFGFERTAALGIAGSAADTRGLPAALLGDPVRVVVPVADATGLRLEVDPPGSVVVDALRRGPMRVVRDGDRLMIQLPMITDGSAGTFPVELVLGDDVEARTLPAELHGWLGGVVVDAVVQGLEGLPVGSYALALRLLGADLQLGTAHVAGPSRMTVTGLPRLSRAGRVSGAVRKPIGSLAAAGRDGIAAARTFGRRAIASIGRRLGRPA